MKKISCKIIEDLIPLVGDGIASDESLQLVKEHIETCPICMDLYKDLDLEKNLNSISNNKDDKEILENIKRKLYMTQTIILIVGTILGVALTNTFGMFYNISLMPILGGLSLLILGSRWYFTPIIIMILVYLYQIVELLVEGSFVWEVLYGGLYLSGIYGGLVVVGVIIALLLRYSFGKDGVNNEK